MRDVLNTLKASLTLMKGFRPLVGSITRFDEPTYLKLNPDVAAAIDNGIISSGWLHYVLHGVREGRPIEDESALEDAYRPVPPSHLRRRVHGDESLSGFIAVGERVAQNVLDALDGELVLGEKSRVLDFGCGCGRVLRELKKSRPTTHFYGTDLDKEAIQWCQLNLSAVAEFAKNEELPPLPLAEDFFDFVCVVSVFTHIPEDMQFAWLAELSRVTKPGGYLVLTTHGEDMLSARPAKRNELREKGFLHVRGIGTFGLPEFYQTAYHTEQYIRTRWGQFFEIRGITKKGIADNQDLVLCRKSA